MAQRRFYCAYRKHEKMMKQRPVQQPLHKRAKFSNKLKFAQVHDVLRPGAAIANQIKAERLLLMTDVPGVNDKNGNLISQLSTKQALDLIDDGTITGGMIPKIKTCISAIESGVNGVVIIDGRKSHAVLFELFSNLGAGTLIVK